MTGDLGHILRASGVGATLDAQAASQLMAARALFTDAGSSLPPDLLHQCTLAGGDDYELAFTAPASRRDAVQEAARRAGVPVTRIGTVDSTPGLRVVDGNGQPLAARYASFDHFGSV